MDINKLKEGRVVGYRARTHAGRGKVVQVYPSKTGYWAIVHDKKRNASVTVRPSQLTK